jgi:uncharacterized protein (DUF1800 family)
MAAPWTGETAARLLQKLGFGPTPAQLAQALREGRQAATNRLLSDGAIPLDALEQRLATYAFDFTTLDSSNYDLLIGLQRWWYLRMIYSPRQLEEKLTLFWHMHFATSYAKVPLVPLMYAQNQIFRAMGGGRFTDLLLAVSRDPAMLIWLDNDTNVRDHPNENFAREVMELFTMGIHHYTQQDVTAAARAFTGWTIDPDKYTFVYDASVHDPDPKTFLGQTGDFTGEQTIAILADRPETIDYVSRKLARFFLGVEPSAALLDRLHTTWLATRGRIRDLVREIAASDDFDRGLTTFQQVRTPTEFMVGALRAIGVETDATQLPDFGYLEGQGLFLPPNVAGWPGGLRWINTGSYLIRMNFADYLASSRPGTDATPLAWSTSSVFGSMIINTPDDLVDQTAARLGMSQPAGATRNALLVFIAQSAGSPFHWSNDVAERTGRGVIHLLLSSAEFQLQ